MTEEQKELMVRFQISPAGTFGNHHQRAEELRSIKESLPDSPIWLIDQITEIEIALVALEAELRILAAT